MKSTFLTIFLLICFSGISQVDDFQKEIIDYLDINGTRVQYSIAFYELFPVLERNFRDKEIPEEAWEELKLDEEDQIDDIISRLTFAYRKYFTREDIAKMNDFYSSEVGQKVVSDYALTEEENAVFQEYLDSDVSKKFEKNRKELTKDIEKISSDWSRELFGTKIKQLVKGGYLTVDKQ
ncbi:DUF2059 domain-containing protein [Aureisphaera sp. CAU 1614]|uniref:DUF2059 domain-containing protein n=1 Tax=Halomarinibacterium sedimenti TaxID=2857106 RepID=A0A9X1K0Y4_9FLAO|nr:DUF2059 domain-containing protein [Halomarinibacterium sedimenti]MBW2938896.1 DUF2059 domain-containing protein [Halomarinibacterium sedimenti]|tara:strand:- start:47778 stop:48314 length:537 start_codon:yes stop_codon:yes gene_type:complete